MWFDWTEQGRAAPAVEAVGARAPSSRFLVGGASVRLPTTPDGNYYVPDGDGDQPIEVTPPALVVSTLDRWHTQPVTIPQGVSDALSARWAPDRSQIVLSARAPIDPAAPARSGDRRVFTRPTGGTTWSEQDAGTGAEIAAQQLFLLGASGSARQLTTPWVEDPMDALPDGDARGNIEPDLSPDGRYVVFSNVSSVGPESWLLRLDLQTGEVFNLTSVSCGPVVCIDQGARFSPDGRHIAFSTVVDGVAQIAVMDADGRNVRHVTRDQSSNVEPAWSPDGRSLAFVRTVTDSGTASSSIWRLIVMDVQSGDARTIAERGEGPVSRPVWDPDGGYVAFLGANAEGQTDIYLVEPDGSGVKRLTTSTTQEFFFDWR
jgi:Tol biopolymer transport system component